MSMDTGSLDSRASRRSNSGGREPKPGRDLRAAITTGVILGALVLGTLFIQKELFVALVTVAIAVGIWELRAALALQGHQVPLIPTVLGAVVILWSAWFGGPELLTVATILSALTVAIWRIADGLDAAARDVSGGIFTVLYPAFLAAFCVLLLAQDDGVARVITFMLVTVCSDVGGYAAGVLFGKHPLAPMLSPKKTWEGLSGSALLAVVGAVACVIGFFDGPWWAGVVLGLLVAAVATIGDLIESAIKRDVGLKDMSHILPGHGGMLDRIDAMLVTAPVVWAILRYLV
ncbi:phosphatidate cytidylyltransferase [Kribbia dieselivorans]|uniref:phosphatidate cytidylyltransferase n=1 Tax=Kribbia dieselivorans TaxID=331526 RepID=UPI0008396C82|nr:phosphatidate cytidylyltransferase [Kribbia dieselivorans]